MTATLSPTEGSPMRVLVVDDQPGLAQTLALSISSLGSSVNVVSATSAKEALALAAINAVDILITDMVMPEMTGLELVEKLQNHPGGRPTYTILMTAYEVPGLRETTRRLNIKETIIKPFHPERMNQLVAKVLAGLPSFPELDPVGKRRSYKLLIADDVPDNITLVSRYMESEGYRYVTASDGIEALEKTRAEMPDLILLDVNMPGKDGFTVLKEIREDPVLQGIPVIIFTAARPHPSDIQSGLVLGADDYIVKPFDRRELFARIRTKLRLKETRDLLLRRNRELRILPEIGRQLSARLNVHEISELVLRRTVESLGALVGYFIGLGARGPIHKEYHLATSPPPALQLPPLTELLEQLKETGESILIEDTSTDPYWRDVFWEQPYSAIIHPVHGRDTLLALFALIHERKGYFDSEHRVLLQAIASQAGIAMENAQLYTAVMQEQSKLTAVMQNAADAILMFDVDGCLVMMNPAAQNLFADRAILGLPLARGHGYDVLIESLEKTLERESSTSTDIPWVDGRMFSGQLTPLADGGCVVIFHDVSHFKQLEKVKNEFIAAASHDLRNPLTTIRGYSQLLLQAGGLNELQADFIRRIGNGARNMGELVDNMLDLAKMDLEERLRFEVIDGTAMLTGLVDEFKPQAEAKEQVITLELAQDKFDIQGDGLKLQQAFRNLMGNAIKYTPPGGRVKVSADARPGSVLVRVEDTGYGIPAADLPNLFKRFHRVRNHGHDEIEGNGLGLAIVKSIVEGHGGTITVESVPDQGSCFTVTLPAMQIQPEPASADQALSYSEFVLK